MSEGSFQALTNQDLNARSGDTAADGRAPRRPRATIKKPQNRISQLQTQCLPDESVRQHSSSISLEEATEQAKPHNIVWVDEQIAGGEKGSSRSKIGDPDGSDSAATMATTYTRRNANGTVGSVYSGNKIRHLKKEDGIPLWRKDIQLEFLRCVFEDDTKCFTMPCDSSKGHSFADIYIDTMARSSKSSKVLKEKLLADRAGALSMGMICLLVNVGRMNTTLNFFPEMRAQLRTFHAIPSLQANQDPNAYKQLQDAPRLKSILKGASEDLNQPGTLEKLKTIAVPRTNPVHLIFLLSQYAPKVSEAHFQPPRDFFDLVMRGTLSSKSRARAFLWLVWWYLESDFTEQAALDNPWGPGQTGEGTDGLPIKVPPFEHLTEAQADAENVDTEEEIRYGELKRLERRRILEDDETVGPPSKKQKKGTARSSPVPSFSGTKIMTLPGHDENIVAISDNDHTRSPSPLPKDRKASADHSGSGVTVPSPVPENGFPHNRYPNIASKPDLPNSQRGILKTGVEDSADLSSPILQGSGGPTYNNRRARHETSHQKAVNMNRKMHIDHLLYKRMASHQNEVRKERRRNSSTFGMMVMNRLKELPDMYDTDDESSWGPGGLVPDQTETDMDDYGEEALRYKKIIDRAIRRLGRADNGQSTAELVKGYGKKRKKACGPEKRLHDGERLVSAKNNGPRQNNGRARPRQKQEDQLDDLDLELLGDNRDDGHEEESALDASEVDAELTEDDVGLQA